MKDYLNKELQKDDLVIFRTPQYSSICIGRIISFTPKKAKIEYINNWNFSAGKRETILIEQSVMIKVEGTEAVLKANSVGL